MGYSEQTENRIRKATEKAKKKREEEYLLSKVVSGEPMPDGPDGFGAVEGDYSPTPTYDEVVESRRNPDPYKEKGPSPILSLEEEDAIRNRIGGKAVDKANAERDDAFDEKQERHGAGEQFPDRFDRRRRMPRSDEEMEELKWGNLKRQGKLQEHNARFGGVPEHLLAEEAETQGTSGVEGASGEQGEQGSALDEFKNIAESGEFSEFSDEKPQQMTEEERDAFNKADAARTDSQSLGDRERWDKADARMEEEENEAELQAEIESIEIEPQGTSEEEAAEEDTAEPMPPLGNQILSDTEAQALANDATEDADGQSTYDRVLEENRIRMEKGGRPDEAEERGRAKATAEEADERIYQEELRNAGHGMSFDEALGAPGATDTTRELAEAQKNASVQQQRLDKQTRDNEFLAGKVDRQNRLDAGESIAEQRAANNPDLQAAIAAKADREAAKPDIHERDKATAAEMAARFEARGPIRDGSTGGSYTRSAVEPPMINKDGKELGSKYYDPTLSEVNNIVVDGVIVAREVVDLEGAREQQTATQKKKGMVWMKPSKGGFKTGDQRFAGQGPGRWMREDQALAADTTNIERPIEEDRRQAVLDKKNRTPQQVAEDNLRAKREHEEELKRIEFDKDDDLEDEAKIELKIKRLRELIQQPGLTAAQRRLYQQQLNALLSGGEVGGAPAGDAPAGDAPEGPSVSDVSNDFALVDPELETDLDSLLDHYVGDDYGVTSPFNPYDWGQVFSGFAGAEINSSNEVGLGYLAGQLSAMFKQGRLKDDPAFLANLKAKIRQKMHGKVLSRLDDPKEADLSAEEWQLVRDFFGPLLADPPTMPTNVDTMTDANMGWGWIGQSGGWGN